MADFVDDHFATKKKPTYKVSDALRAYLTQYNREVTLPVDYPTLLNWQETAPLYDSSGRDTLWQTVLYRPEDMRRLNRALTALYALLKTEGDFSSTDHLYTDRIDYCAFGNSRPFRIRIVNARNDNQDYYYVKRADASRVYGLELEHLLSPNRIHYLTDRDTLIEEHIVGVPGDIFIARWLDSPNIKPIRLAKELVKFNERCFVRLLGDMRPYNFVVDVTPDFEEAQIRIRAMDFDQQSYSGKKNFYLPQYFKDNLPLVNYCTRLLDPSTARQYQLEEQALIHRRTQIVKDRLGALLAAMRGDELSTEEKTQQLASALADHHDEPRFLECKTMGQLVTCSLQHLSRILKR